MHLNYGAFQILGILSCIISLCFSNYGITDEQADEKALTEIENILELPEDQIDLAYTHFLIEGMLYPNISIPENLSKLDEIVSIIETMPEYGSTSLERLGTTLRYLYTPGSWNNYQTYTYDLDDPFGTKRPQGKSVANYLNTKKGNCVSMPILLLLLSEKLDVDTHLSIAPHHLFIRYTDAQGVINNIETTSGTLLNDIKYIESFDIHPDAIKNGIYLKSLSKKEAIAVMLYEVGRLLLHNKHYEKAHALADLMIKYHPKLINAMLLKGNLYSMELQQELAYLKAADLPITNEIRLKLDPLYEQNLAWFSKAESLGWREPSIDYEERYLRSLEEFKIKLR